MKLSNKLIIFSACLCVFAFALLLSAWVKAPKGSVSPDAEVRPGYKTDVKTVETEKNISEPVKNETAQSAYALRIENGRICAYMCTDDGREVLWNSTDIPPVLSEEERLALQNGIYTNSFEELCLYFESYAS